MCDNLWRMRHVPAVLGFHKTPLIIVIIFRHHHYQLEQMRRVPLRHCSPQKPLKLSPPKQTHNVTNKGGKRTRRKSLWHSFSVPPPPTPIHPLIPFFASLSNVHFFVSSTLSCSIALYLFVWHALPSSALSGCHYLNHPSPHLSLNSPLS